MKLERKELASGIYLTAIETPKFKSACLTLTLLTPLKKETASVNALVPHVLHRGTEQYPTMRHINEALDQLYGASWEPVVRKRGETQGIGFVGSFIDDAFTMDNDSVLKDASQMLYQLLLCPIKENGVFKAEYVAGEKENLIDVIRSQMNDKRQYATVRLVQEMCQGEAYGVGVYGSETTMAAVTPEAAWNAYETLLKTARVEIQYCGSCTLTQVETLLQDLVSGLLAHREETVSLASNLVSHAGNEVKRVVDRLDVTQGKLTLGFRTGGICNLSPEHPALRVFHALYGGTATSKLFMNVREKLSLCYYASSTVESMKGIMVVSSGVEFDKMAQAEREILAQLDAVKAGEFTANELESAKQSIISSYASVPDSRATLVQYYLNAAISDFWVSPEEMAERVSAVTAEDVRKVAQSMELDTVYCLLGKEEQ